MSAATDLVRQLPFVTRLDEPEACQGLMAHTPLKAIYRMGGKPPAGLDNYRCKKPGWWRFRALKRSDARDGVYCWPHLVSRGLYAGTLETARTRRALDRLRDEA